jgi:hypothetical protein
MKVRPSQLCWHTVAKGARWPWWFGHRTASMETNLFAQARVTLSQACSNFWDSFHPALNTGAELYTLGPQSLGGCTLCGERFNVRHNYLHSPET